MEKRVLKNAATAAACVTIRAAEPIVRVHSPADLPSTLDSLPSNHSIRR